MGICISPWFGDEVARKKMRTMVIDPLAINHKPQVYISEIFRFSTSLSATSSAEKVKLGLYYETLCPGCSDFMVNHLPKIFTNGLMDIVNLHLVPYGNAKVDNGIIYCQHGEDECLLNTVEACAIHVWPELATHYKFLHCVEKLVVAERHTEWESCYRKTGLDPQPIRDCTKGKMGKQLELKYGNETDHLIPPHKFVPWVIVDEKPIQQDAYNFMKYICEAYKGTKPKACKDISTRVISEMEGDGIVHVCHNEAGKLP